VRGQAYGFGLTVEHDPARGDVVGHGGGYPGFGSHMRWHPVSGLGVVVLGNATYAPAARLTGQLLDHLLSCGPGHRAAGRSGPVPSPSDADRAMTAATLAARADVDRLITAWDDALAARLFAANVALDEPLDQRRAAIELAAHDVGPLSPEPGAPWSSSPAHLEWWLHGPGGRVRVEIRMSPELPPRVQALSVGAVRYPPPAVRALADKLAAALGHPDPVWPGGWELPIDAADAAHRALRVAAAWWGGCRVTAVTAGDGESHAAFHLDAVTAPDGCTPGPLHLELTWTPGTRRLTSLTVAPSPRG